MAAHSTTASTVRIAIITASAINVRSVMEAATIVAQVVADAQIPAWTLLVI